MMSFILQILTSTEHEHPLEASAWIDAANVTPVDCLERMNAFVAEMRTVTVGTERTNGDDSFWPEDLDEVSVAARAYNVAANLAQLTHRRMAAVAIRAAKHDLQLLDPQNGLLWRADGQLVNMKGQAAAFTPAAILKPRKLATSGLDGAEIMRNLIASVKPILDELGFEHEERSSGKNADHKFSRQVGDVQQEVRLGLFYERTWGALNFTVSFDSAELRRCTPMITDFASSQLRHTEFYRRLSLEYLKCPHPLVTYMPALHKNITKRTNLKTVGTQMKKWLRQWIDYGLIPASSLKGLAELALSETAVTEEMRGWFGRDLVRLAVLLTLAAVYKPEQLTVLTQALSVRLKANPTNYSLTPESNSKREALLAHIGQLQPEINA